MLNEEGVIHCHAGRRARVLARPGNKYRIGIVIDNGKQGIPPFTYDNAGTCWLMHNAVQMALMKRHTPSITLPPEMDYSSYAGQLDGILLVRDTDGVWRFPLYPDRPAVTIWNQPPPEEWVNGVYPDREAAILRAGVYFLTHGVRQLWAVAPERRMDWFDSLEQFLRDRGVEDCHRLPVHSNFGKALEELFDAMIRPQLKLPVAIITGGDYLSRELNRTMIAAGLQPKKDFFMVGGSGLTEAAHWQPALSVVGMPFLEMAESAVTMLFDLLKHPGARFPLCRVPARLILRET
ncbi:hypothetical protein SDC9_93544 [bioreactor metagenome]|uniref:Transcriptional regulator LacI/GalR-like sensor domain-containing protein n=1 Tax=bioreactor metagenome TaxID=1076179 RepID=A0A645A1A8_9ZZZZ